MKFVAFDIDGTLTERRVARIYDELSGRENIAVGIVSSRPSRSAMEFIRDNNFKVDFEEMGFFKTIPLIRERLWLGRSGDEFVYVGNTFRDQFASLVTGWRFIHSEDVTIEKILNG